MQIPILVEPIEGGRFRARCVPFELAVEGESRFDVLRRMEVLIQTRRNQGVELHMLEVGSPQSFTGLAGMHDPNDPYIQQWKKAVEEYRQQVDEGPDFPWLEQPESKTS